MFGIFENVFKPVLIGHWHIITSRLQVHCLNLPVLTHRDLRIDMYKNKNYHGVVIFKDI